MRYRDDKAIGEDGRQAAALDGGETLELCKEPEFAAILTPHRSLSPGGFVFLMSAVGVISCAAGIAFTAAGAWPVLCFFVLNVGLIYHAFRLNYRSGELYETVNVTTDTVTVTRVLPSGLARQWEFNPYWARCEVSECRGRATELTLASHGRRLVFGGFLNDDEKRDFAQALSGVLHKLRGGSNR